jgi:hypothetical protein
MTRRFSLQGLFLSGLLALSTFGPAPLGAQDGEDGIAPEPSDGSLQCKVEGSTVELSWNIVFVAPIDAWIVSRDGERLAELPPEATSFVDEGVPDGEHVYALAAINSIGGGIGFLGRCAVVVGDFGLRCRADGLDVHLQWGPILIDVYIERFIIRRDGDVIATVPADVLEHTDTVPGPGAYRYTVHAQTGPAHAFLVGACTVRVPASGFICAVAPPEVLIDWSRVPLPAIAFDYFLVVRNGEAIARTLETRHTDRPGPGEHHYAVFAVIGPSVLAAPGDSIALIPGPSSLFLVGECKIVMPGEGVPPPEELTCVDLDAPPELSDEDLLRAHDVLLVWQKPVEYDWVVIARNYEFVARIPGSQFYYVDRDVPPGEYDYQVFGVLGNRISPPATCHVSLPRPPVPPPHSLTCEFVGALDPANTSTTPPGYVQMRWRNGAAYDFIVITRNGRALARVAGGATSYRDDSPPPGRSTYGVFGVVGIRRSDAAECEVLVPVGHVPPVEHLRCALIRPVPVPLPVPVDPADFGSADTLGAGNALVDGTGVDAIDIADDGDVARLPAVLLSWENPVLYDRLIILRNNLQIAVIPGTSQSYIDHPNLLSATITYSVIGLIGKRRSEPATCTVVIEPPAVPPPRDLRCVVIGLTSASGGVVPIADPVANDEIAPDPSPVPVPVVHMTWVNPVRYTALVVLRDNLRLAELPGTALLYNDINPPAGKHVYSLFGVTAGGGSDPVRCEVEVPPAIVPPVRDLTCIAIQDTAGTAGVGHLRWTNAARYDEIVILRDGEHNATLPGGATEHFDRGLAPGVHEYQVIAVIGSRSSAPAECRVVVGGEPPRNLLYFSSGLFEPAASNADIPVPVDRCGRITCLASNHDPIQGWSFGVSHDPSVLELRDADLHGTVTAGLNEGMGPSFIVMDRFENGITMAVVIDTADPSDTLAPAASHPLLNLEYGPGPLGLPGGRYPVRYTDILGEPPVAVLYVVQGFEVAPATAPGVVCVAPEIGPFLLRGDVTGDLEVTMTDAIRILNWLFLGGRRPTCLESADVNGSREINIADPVYELQWEFSGGPRPPAPFPDCGEDDAPLGCEEPTCPQPL